MFLSILKPLAVVSTIALSTLGVLSRKYRRARYAFHLTLYAGTLGFMSVAGVFISLAATIAGQVSVTPVLRHIDRWAGLSRGLGELSIYSPRSPRATPRGIY